MIEKSYNDIQYFITEYSSEENLLLKNIASHTLANQPHAHMMSSGLQAVLLSMISHMIKPKFVLEIGTFTGVSALALAEGLIENGELHTIELREETAEIAKQNFQQSAFANKIKLHTGDAHQIINELKHTWDLIFVDADKVSYIDYFNLIFPNLPSNSFMLFDNIFFHGTIFNAENVAKNTKAIILFNDFIKHRTDITKIILPIRDGLYLIKKN